LMIASGSWDNTARVWDEATGVQHWRHGEMLVGRLRDAADLLAPIFVPPLLPQGSVGGEAGIKVAGDLLAFARPWFPPVTPNAAARAAFAAVAVAAVAVLFFLTIDGGEATLAPTPV
ncbi:hypothetical protein HK405_003363, partial [Cladochytrium tenue]